MSNTSYVSVACGYSANIIISTMDPLLARITEETAVINGISKNTIGPLSNYYFMIVSTILITITIYYIVKTKLIKQLVFHENNSNYNKPLSRKERRALLIAWSTGIIYLLIILLSTFSSFGILRGVSGNLMRSPFIMGILFLISFGIGLMGMVYGLVSGKYKSDSDIIQGLAEPIRMLGVYFVIAFFAAQMFACLEYSNIDKYLIVRCANIFVNIEMSVLPMMIVFILFSAIINLMMVSATSKWSFIGFIFIPIFYQMGVAPDIVQCAFRIGDSSTNAITPFLFYMPLILTYMLHYDKKASYLSLLKYTWRFSVYIFIVWTILFILWHLLKIPFGL